MRRLTLGSPNGHNLRYSNRTQDDECIQKSHSEVHEGVEHREYCTLSDSGDKDGYLEK